jgi:tRNA uracil 4-sulfurtransferase
VKVHLKKIILIRYGEVLLKGLNRPFFESRLIRNIKSAVYRYGPIKVEKSQSRIYVEPLEEEYDIDGAMEAICKVFGVVSVSPVYKIKSSLDDIKDTSFCMLTEIFKMQSHNTFKVVTKRGDKHFPLNSQEINAVLGEYILEVFPSLTVDVHTPSITVYVEVRESTYIYSEIIKAFGGLPVGTNGKAILMLSGGIDSPVAGWMMLKRGVEIEAVHFYSYPYTSERSKDKVIELVRILAEYCGKINLHIVPFTDIQLKIRDNCPHDENTIIMRRLMMKIAERIAAEKNAQALISGESMGQVASQTIQSLAVTNDAVNIPVFRPLIGLDKNEVIEISRKINTFETSILPYEDCCTVFVPKHPKTKPRLPDILRSENRIEWEEFIKDALSNLETISVEGYRKH